MTAEQINKWITDTGIDRVVADIISRGYYVKLLTTTPIAPTSSLVNGKVALMDASGFPQHSIRVKVTTLRLPQTVTANTHTYHVSQSQTDRSYETNADGLVLIPLIKGSKVRIHIENGYTRELTVPTSDFDIVSLTSDDHDAFVTPNAPYVPLVRRN